MAALGSKEFIASRSLCRRQDGVVLVVVVLVGVLVGAVVVPMGLPIVGVPVELHEEEDEEEEVLVPVVVLLAVALDVEAPTPLNIETSLAPIPFEAPLAAPLRLLVVEGDVEFAAEAASSPCTRNMSSVHVARYTLLGTLYTVHCTR